MCSAVLSPFSIQHGPHFRTNNQRKPRVSKWWAAVAMTWPPRRRLSWVSNAPLSADRCTEAVIYRRGKSPSRTSRKQSSQLAYILPLYFSTWACFWRTCETPISLPRKRFQWPAEPWKSDFTGLVDLPPLHKISYNEYDAADESEDSSGFGGEVGTPPISPNPTELSPNQFAKMMGQAKCSACNKWKNVWVAGFSKKKHRYIIWTKNHLKLPEDGPRHWKTPVAE